MFNKTTVREEKTAFLAVSEHQLGIQVTRLQ